MSEELIEKIERANAEAVGQIGGQGRFIWDQENGKRRKRIMVVDTVKLTEEEIAIIESSFPVAEGELPPKLKFVPPLEMGGFRLPPNFLNPNKLGEPT